MRRSPISRKAKPTTAVNGSDLHAIAVILREPFEHFRKEKVESEMTCKIKMALYAFFSKIIDGTQPGLNTSKSMGSKFEKYSLCTQLPEIYGFHF